MAETVSISVGGKLATYGIGSAPSGFPLGLWESLEISLTLARGNGGISLLSSEDGSLSEELLSTFYF